jgi:hypothetical protein
VLQPEIGQPFKRDDIATWHRLAKELWDSRRIDLTQMPPEEMEEREEREDQEEQAMASKDEDGLPF